MVPPLVFECVERGRCPRPVLICARREAFFPQLFRFPCALPAPVYFPHFETSHLFSPRAWPPRPPVRGKSSVVASLLRFAALPALTSLDASCEFFGLKVFYMSPLHVPHVPLFFGLPATSFPPWSPDLYSLSTRSRLPTFFPLSLAASARTSISSAPPFLDSRPLWWARCSAFFGSPFPTGRRFRGFQGAPGLFLCVLLAFVRGSTLFVFCLVSVDIFYFFRLKSSPSFPD